MVLVHGRREKWEEQLALGGTIDLCEWGLDLNFFHRISWRTLTGQIAEEARRQGDPSVWSIPISLATESRAGHGLKGATPLSQCLTHLSLSVLNELHLIVIGLNAVP